MQHLTVCKDIVFLECSPTFTEGIDINEVAQLAILSRHNTMIQYCVVVLEPEHNTAVGHLNEILKLRLIQRTKKPGRNQAPELARC